MNKLIYFLPIILFACGQPEQTHSNANVEEHEIVDSSVTKVLDSDKQIEEEISEIMDPLVGSWSTAVRVKGDWYEVGGVDNQLHIIQNNEDDYTMHKNNRCGKAIQLEHQIISAKMTDDGTTVIEAKYPNSKKTIKMIGSYQLSDDQWPARIFNLERNTFTELITEGVMEEFEIESVKLYQGAEQGKEPKKYNDVNCESKD